MEYCARKQCQKLCTFLFAATCAFGKMWSRIPSFCIQYSLRYRIIKSSLLSVKYLSGKEKIQRDNGRLQNDLWQHHADVEQIGNFEKIVASEIAKNVRCTYQYSLTFLDCISICHF